MTNKIRQDTKEAIWVTPPTTCWISDREREAQNGIQEKKEPKTLLIPYKKAKRDHHSTKCWIDHHGE